MPPCCTAAAKESENLLFACRNRLFPGKQLVDCCLMNRFAFSRKRTIFLKVLVDAMQTRPHVCFRNAGITVALWHCFSFFTAGRPLLLAFLRATAVQAALLQTVVCTTHFLAALRFARRTSYNACSRAFPRSTTLPWPSSMPEIPAAGTAVRDILIRVQHSIKPL